MAIESKNFKGGGINTDDAIEDLGPNDWIEAHNIRVTGTVESEAGDVTNIESNSIIVTAVQAGLNKSLGAIGFDRIRKGIAIIYNSQGYNQIRELDYDTLTETILFENLTNSGGIDILPLNPEFYVTDIKLTQDKYLSFNDGYGNPYYVNLDRLRSGGYGILRKEDLTLIKGQPMLLPTLYYNNDSGRSVNQLSKRLFQFREQWEMLDYELTSWGSISKRIFPIDEPTPSVGTDVTKSNNIVVSVDAGNNRVKRINVAARYDMLDWFLVKSIDRTTVIELPNTEVDVEQEIYEAYNPTTNIYSFAFYNDALFPNISPLETDEPYDYVPDKAGAMEIINGSILALGDITEGYPRPIVDVNISVSSYDPQLLITPTLPNPLIVLNAYDRRPGGTHSRYVTVVFSGSPKTGDKIKIQFRDLRNFSIVVNYVYTVTSIQNSNLPAVLASLAALIPSSSISGNTITSFTESYFELSYAKIELQNAGTGESKSIPALKNNSSYTLALAHYRGTGKYYPLVSDERFVIKTPSYAFTRGLIPRIDWAINSLPPEGATSYQWLISKNNTHEKNLFINGEYKDDLSDGDYLVFNIQSLAKFNETNSSSILNYEYSPGDRVTFMFTFVGTTATPTQWFDTTAIDVEVVGYDVVVDETDPTIITYLLKVRKSSALDTANLINKETLLELYTPKKRTFETSGETEYSTNLWFEFGERFDIIEGQYAVKNGSISEGDSFFKTRQLTGNIDTNTLYTLLVEDFNFSDFYKSNYTSYGRARSYDDELETTERKASIRYSDMFIAGSKVNGLNRFYGARIYGDNAGETSSSYGAIGKLRMRDNYLVCLQELKVGHIPVNMSIVEDQIEQKQYAISDKLLNYVRYLSGNYGIGKAKESYAEGQNGAIYFADPNNSLPIRDGRDGLKPIAIKTTKHFKKVIKQAQKDGKKIIGVYDNFNDEYFLSIEDSSGVLITYKFNNSDWELYDDYIIDPSTLALVSDINGTLVINPDGTALFTPDLDYVGSAGIIFSFVDNGTTINVNECITVLTGNNEVNPFYFIDVFNSNISFLTVSNSVLITGPNVSVDVSIVGGEWSKNGGAWTTGVGSAIDGDIITVRRLSGDSYGDVVSAVLTVGSYSDSFDIQNRVGAFGNAYASEEFTKDDCVLPEVGSTYLYEVPANKYYGITQIAADALAQEEIDDFGQDKANEEGVCGLVVYYNVETTGYATRNNCGVGLVPGPPVAYTISANNPSCTSNISQEDANAKAQALVDANKQSNANANGTCVTPTLFTNDYQSQNIQRNNCSGGQIGGFWLVSVAAGVYSAPTKLEANNLALAYIASNGQSIANANGTCSVPSYFTFEIVMYDNYRNVRYDPSDSRGKSFEFANGIGYSNVFAAKLVSTTINRDNTVYTFSIPFPGPTIAIGSVICYLTTSATSVSGSFDSVLKHNGAYVGYDSQTVTSGIAIDTKYTRNVATAIYTTLDSSSILRLEHGTPSDTTVYYSAPYSAIATRNNCPLGQDPVGTVTLTAVYGQFTSTISQGDANSQAVSWVEANKQANANSFGTCSVVCTLGITTTKTNETSSGANNGTITVTATGGVGTLQFSKNNGSTWITATSPYTFNSLSPATYPIKVKDANNCEATASVVISAGGVTCDLSIAFVSKTNETTSGANNGTITITGSTSYVGGFLLSKDGGVSYLYTGTSPFTFTALAPGTYNIRAKNANNTCQTSSIPVVIEAYVPACDLVLTFSSKTDETTVGGNNGTITVTGSTSYSGGFVLSKDNGGTFPFTGTSPYTFTGLAPGVYNIKARNSNGTCTTSISAVTINAFVPPSCDLVLTFSSKTDETVAGYNDGTITVTGSTSYIGGFLLSKNGGGSYPYTGTSPYTFTDLAPGYYSINAINADGSCGTSLPESILIGAGIQTDAVGVIVVDFYNLTTLEMCGFIDGTGFPYDTPVYKNTDNFLPNDGTPAANCWALASDLIAQPVLKFRFEFNVKKLLLTYPSETSFVFKIRGRGVGSGTVSLLYDLKGVTSGDMTMMGSSGSYIPSVNTPDNLGSVSTTRTYVSGADGNIGLAYGSDIITLTYNVATKVVTAS